MGKAPEPSPWGLIIVVLLFAGLIWHGPMEDDIEVHDSIQHGNIDCMKDLKYLTPTQLELCIDIQSFKKDSDYE